jgi:hypothetical protein
MVTLRFNSCMNMTAWGIFSLGFVFGYLLYYAVRHTEKFNIELLSSAIAAIGGGALIEHAQKEVGWLGPYGLGIGAGFLFYLLLSLILIVFFKGTDQTGAGGPPLTLLRRTLLGVPKHD